ncbi:MAG: hypothetical protein R3242_08220, partial [Akkermansiaceae bacterium]|nr:hypothetical protein [Akkermansiaceae bacterium]
MTFTTRAPLYLALLLFSFISLLPALKADDKSDDAIRFTSVPDIFNWNISYPQPGWEEAMDWYFDRLKEEGPDFTLCAGDIMDARWWD